ATITTWPTSAARAATGRPPNDHQGSSHRPTRPGGRLPLPSSGPRPGPVPVQRTGAQARVHARARTRARRSGHSPGLPGCGNRNQPQEGDTMTATPAEPGHATPPASPRPWPAAHKWLAGGLIIAGLAIAGLAFAEIYFNVTALLY